MNALLTSIYNDVVTITKRPDLSAQTLLAVQNATLKAHTIDFWKQDLIEASFAFQDAADTYSLAYKSIVPRYRKLNWMRKLSVDPNTAPVGDNYGYPLQVVDPSVPLDSYGYIKSDVVYLAGLDLKIRVSDQCKYFSMGCWIYPVITTAQYESWIASEIPTAVVFEAVRTVFKSIGRDDQAKAQEILVAEAFAMVRLQGIETDTV